jgi:hypothetical protein
MRTLLVRFLQIVAASMLYSFFCVLGGSMAGLVWGSVLCRTDPGLEVDVGDCKRGGAIVAIIMCRRTLLAVAAVAAFHSGGHRRILVFSAIWGCLSGLLSVAATFIVPVKPEVGLGVIVVLISVGLWSVWCYLPGPKARQDDKRF